MDRADRELLALLAVRIAAIMEDEVEQAVLRLPSAASDMAALFQNLKAAGHDIVSLSSAATTVLRRAGPDRV